MNHVLVMRPENKPHRSAEGPKKHVKHKQMCSERHETCNMLPQKVVKYETKLSVTVISVKKFRKRTLKRRFYTLKVSFDVKFKED